jgi:hypothetical protein
MAKICPLEGCKDKEGMCIHDKIMVAVVLIAFIAAAYLILI